MQSSRACVGERKAVDVGSGAMRDPRLAATMAPAPPRRRIQLRGHAAPPWPRQPARADGGRVGRCWLLVRPGQMGRVALGVEARRTGPLPLSALRGAELQGHGSASGPGSGPGLCCVVNWVSGGGGSFRSFHFLASLPSSSAITAALVLQVTVPRLGLGGPGSLSGHGSKLVPSLSP